jgi:tRNA pseudouridine38-40 synthase
MGGINVKAVIRYDGTGFHGFQRQKNTGLRTIQGVLEDKISAILQEKVKVIGATRTDAGVHAVRQVVNFRISKEVDLAKLKHSLNSLLPDDLKILHIKKVSHKFHSRYNAKSKIYKYIILNDSLPDPLRRNRVWHIPQKLDVEIMRKECKNFLGRHDFSSFAKKSSKSEKSPYCEILRCDVKKNNKEITIWIEGNRFLYNMVRRIVGYLVQKGLHKEKILPLLAPPEGLYLWKVKY